MDMRLAGHGARQVNGRTRGNDRSNDPHRVDLGDFIVRPLVEEPSYPAGMFTATKDVISFEDWEERQPVSPHNG